MGAHLSTVQGTLTEQFEKHDDIGKGYLSLREYMSLRTPYGISPSHLGVLHQLDRDRDGRITLGELHAYAAFADAYMRLHPGRDSCYMLAGLASLSMWRAMRDDAGREEFVDWAMQLLTNGHEVAEPEGCEGPCVHRRALKALHVLFDVERTMGMDYFALRDLMHAAAAEQQLLDPEDPTHEEWLPLETLRLFVEALADGVAGMLESFFQGDADETLLSVERTLADVGAAHTLSSSGSGSGSCCGGFRPAAEAAMVVAEGPAGQGIHLVSSSGGSGRSSSRGGAAEPECDSDDCSSDGGSGSEAGDLLPQGNDDWDVSSALSDMGSDDDADAPLSPLRSTRMRRTLVPALKLGSGDGVFTGSTKPQLQPDN